MLKQTIVFVLIQQKGKIYNYFIDKKCNLRYNN